MTLEKVIKHDAEALIKAALVANVTGKILISDEVELSASDYTQALIGELVRLDYLKVDACLLLPGPRAEVMDISDVLGALKKRGAI